MQKGHFRSLMKSYEPTMWLDETLAQHGSLMSIAQCFWSLCLPSEAPWVLPLKSSSSHAIFVSVVVHEAVSLQKPSSRSVEKQTEQFNRPRVVRLGQWSSPSGPLCLCSKCTNHVRKSITVWWHSVCVVESHSLAICVPCELQCSLFAANAVTL